MARRIVSIAAAPGWAAKFDGDERVVTLLAWALVEDDGAPGQVVGLVQRSPTPEQPAGYVGLADEVDGFNGYTVGALQTKPAAGHS